MSSLHKSIAAALKQVRPAAMVWCRECGESMQVDYAVALRFGWPKCCKATMTIDAPKKRAGR